MLGLALKFNVGKFKPPEVIGLTLSHKLFAVVACIINTGLQLEMKMCGAIFVDGVFS